MASVVVAELHRSALGERNGFIPGDAARSAVIREWKEFD